MVDDWAVPSYRQENIQSEILDSGIKQIKEKQEEKKKELADLKRKVIVAKALTPLKRLDNGLDRISNKLQTYGQKRTISRNLVKKSNVQVDIKKLTDKEYAYKDKPRYYRAVFQEEKRKLFFK